MKSTSRPLAHVSSTLALTLSLVAALAAPPASACAMYIPPSQKVVVEAAPVKPAAPVAYNANAIDAPAIAEATVVPAAPSLTDLQRAMLLIDGAASVVLDAMPTSVAPTVMNPAPTSAPPMGSAQSPRVTAMPTAIAEAQ